MINKLYHPILAIIFIFWFYLYLLIYVGETTKQTSITPCPLEFNIKIAKIDYDYSKIMHDKFFFSLKEDMINQINQANQ